MASSSTNSVSAWWIEKEGKKLHVHRIKNKQSVRIPIERILPMPSSATHIQVQTIHPNCGVLDKEFNLRDFQCKRNDISTMMESALANGKDFVDRYNHLFPNNSASNISEGDILERQTVPDYTNDACELEAIRCKRVKFGNDNMIEIPVSLLSSPPPERLVRPLNEPHIAELKVGLEKQGIVFNHLIVHIHNHLSCHITKEDLLNGRYSLETIGGNHTRQALADLKQVIMVPVIVYAGLTNDQVLMVGYEHNRLHKSSRPMTFEEDVLLFRSRLVGDPDQGLSQQQRTKWRQRMAAILGLHVKDIRMKYRVHSFLASQPKEIWCLIKQIMKAWELNLIKGQPQTPLKPTTLRFLETLPSQELKITLSKLLDGELTFKEARCPEKPQPPESVSSKKRRITEDQLAEWEARLMRKETQLKEWEARLKLQEKSLQDEESDEEMAEELNGTEEHSSAREHQAGQMITEEVHEASDIGEQSSIRQHQEGQFIPEEIHMPNGDTCKQGEWVAVLYGRKASVGRVVSITAKDKASVHFLKGKKMSKADIQDVVDKFCICKVDVEHDIDRDEIIITDQSNKKIKRETSIYIETYM